MSESKEDILARYLKDRMEEENNLSSKPSLPLLRRALSELDEVSLPPLDIDLAIYEQKSRQSVTKFRKVRQLAWLTTAAAAAVLITIFTLKIVNKSHDLYLQSGEVSLLPDGVSTALSHTSAEISFKTSSPRKLILKGNAFFQVSSGAPFKVQTSWGSISVLATSFEVIQEELFEVSCFT